MIHLLVVSAATAIFEYFSLSIFIMQKGKENFRNIGVLKNAKHSQRNIKVRFVN